MEDCNGWRYVVEEIESAGFEAHVAEPADTQAMQGRRKRAKTDRTDARLLRDLLAESWIPPAPVLEWWERTRLYKSLIDQRLVWVQRIHAELYRHGITLPAEHIRSDTTRRAILGRRGAAGRGCPAADRGRLPDNRGEPRRRRGGQGPGPIHAFGRNQPACRALEDRICGLGTMAAVVVWSELGACRRHSLPTGWSATPDWTSSTPRTSIEGVATCPGRVQAPCGGCCSMPACARRGRRAPTASTTGRSSNATRYEPPWVRWRLSCHGQINHRPLQAEIARVHLTLSVRVFLMGSPRLQIQRRRARARLPSPAQDVGRK